MAIALSAQAQPDSKPPVEMAPVKMVEAPSKTPTIEDVYLKGTFAAKSVGGYHGMNDGKSYAAFFTDANKFRHLLRFDYQSGKVVDTIFSFSKLMHPETGKPLQVAGYVFSEDEKKVLLQTDVNSIYRRSSTVENFVLDLTTKKIVRLSKNGPQMEATFSPDGNKVAFARGNNLFFVDLTTGSETQFTTDGKKNAVINGTCDWVYEEEFEFVRAFYWSTDSKKISFIRFDESAVPEYSMPMYFGLYPENETFKYPKAGEANSKVSAHLYNLDTKSLNKVDLGSDFEYIPRMGWSATADKFWLMRMNRHQNKNEVILVDATTLSTKVLWIETSKTWVEVNDDITFLAGNAGFVWTSEASGFRHLWKYEMATGKMNQITTGNFDIAEFYGYNASTKTLFYQTAEPTPMDRQVWSISIDGKTKKLLAGDKGFNVAIFNPQFTYFILNFSTANTPAYITLNDKTGKRVRVLEENLVLSSLMKEYSLSEKVFFSIENEAGTPMNGWMMKPQNFDPTKKYPVLMTVYGGPGSQQVLNRWGGGDYFYHQYLCSKGYVVVCIDGRGTGLRGVEYKNCTYQQLGKYEIEDQIFAAKNLNKKFTFIDPARIGMFGWSFGGYMSSLAITKGADVFKTAVAVAPVINWRYYDNIYTERYMRTPQENADGYDKNSPSTFAEKVKGNYLIIHGTADDNVHFQNSMMMIKALQDKGIQFDFEAYPNKNHSIGGGKTRYQLFTKISNYLFENL